MKILITGATGFIGRELVRQIAKSGRKADFCCLVRQDNEFLKSMGISTVKCDLLEREKLASCLNGFQAVIHLAGVVNAVGREFYTKNVLLTKNLLDACRTAHVKRFVLISTAIVNSKVQGNYSKSKIEAERLVRESGLDYVIIRPSVVYGEEDTKNIGGIVSLVRKLPVVPILGSGNYLLQPVYVVDVAKAILSAVSGKKASGRAYFIAGPKPVSFNCIVDLIARQLGVRRFKLHIPKFIPILLVRIYESIVKSPVIVYEQMARMAEDKVYSIAESVKDLNFKPIPIEEGIKRVLK
jgi:nucleoside-diphosphate-sugar epimerase